jgi:hypothetical protein
MLVIQHEDAEPAPVDDDPGLTVLSLCQLHADEVPTF